MKELLLLGALGVFVWLLRGFLGPPVRRLPHEARPAGPNPEADVPMADTPIIIDTGSGEHPRQPIMRRLIRVLVVVSTLLAAAACQPPAPLVPTPTPRPASPAPPTLPAERDPSFALHFEYGVCYTHVLDTEAGTYERIVPGEAHVEIPLVLSEADMGAIYEKLRAINFLSYPARFTLPVPTDGIVIEVIPWTDYQLTVRSGDLRHTVAWSDTNPRATDPQAQKLRELFRLISGIIGLKPELQALPAPKVFCL